MKTGEFEVSDFYALLGVTSDASGLEIKAAYWKAAKQHHPDVNVGDKTAEQRIKELNQAYEILSDREARAAYELELGRQRNVQKSFNLTLAGAAALALVLALLWVPVALRQHTETHSFAAGAPLRAENKTQADELRVSLQIGDRAKLSFAAGTSDEGEASGQRETASNRDTLDVPRAPPNPKIAAAPFNDKEAPTPDKRAMQSSLEAQRRPYLETSASSEPGSAEQIPMAIASQKHSGIPASINSYRKTAVAEIVSRKPIVLSKTIKSAGIALPDKKRNLEPERPVISAKRALLDLSVNRTLLAAAPGG